MGHCDGDGPWWRGLLPEGWSAATDETSGFTYYYNEQTRECTWERPLTAAVLDETTDGCCFLQGNALVSPQHLEVRPTLPVFHTRKPLRFLCARHLA